MLFPTELRALRWAFSQSSGASEERFRRDKLFFAGHFRSPLLEAIVSKTFQNSEVPLGIDKSHPLRRDFCFGTTPLRCELLAARANPGLPTGKSSDLFGGQRGSVRQGVLRAQALILHRLQATLKSRMFGHELEERGLFTVTFEAPPGESALEREREPFQAGREVAIRFRLSSVSEKVDA